MKTKTAQIHAEPVWGTSKSIWVVIRYRGHSIMGFHGHKADTPELVGKAYAWAKNQGFTHMNTQLTTTN